jgi:uncharacterized membrane protein YqjE
MPGEMMSDVDRPKLTELLADIGSDLHKMVEQQIQMARAEMAAEVSKAKQMVVLAVIAGTLTFFSLAFGLLTLAQAIHVWAPDLPWWAVYGIVALITAVIGLVFLAIARHRASTIHVTPDRTLETFKESITWTRS